MKGLLWYKLNTHFLKMQAV